MEIRSSSSCYFNFDGIPTVVGCTWQGKACQLVVNHEEGFVLYSSGTRGSAGNGVSPGSSPTPLWRRSFDKLKMSADDGARLLWLDFGGEDGEIVSNLIDTRITERSALKDTEEFNIPATRMLVSHKFASTSARDEKRFL